MKFLLALKCFHKKDANVYKKNYILDPMMPLSMFSSPLPLSSSLHLLFNATTQVKNTERDVIVPNIRHV